MTAKRFLEKSRYYLATEYPTKIRLAVADLSYDDIWRRPNEDSNSIGNLVVHLAGNIRQWIVAGIGGAPSDRDRASEFAMRNGPMLPELLNLLDAAVKDADKILAKLDKNDLAAERTIQGRETNVLDAIYHVVEHFSMHTGQIIMLTKMLTASDLRFYEFEEDVPTQRWLK